MEQTFRGFLGPRANAEFGPTFRGAMRASYAAPVNDISNFTTMQPFPHHIKLIPIIGMTYIRRTTGTAWECSNRR